MRIFLFFVIFLCSHSVYGDGVYTAGAFSYDAINTEFDNQFKTSLTAGYEWKGVYIEGTQQTFMEKGFLYAFSPYRAKYFATAGYKYKAVYIEYEHLCIHGVDRFGAEGGHGRLTIGFDTRQNEKD